MRAVGLRAQPLLGLDDAELAGGGFVNFQRRLVDAGGDHRDTDHAIEALIECRAEDDIGLFVDLLTNAACRFVNLIEGQIVAAGDRNQQAARALHRHFVEQRIGDRRFGRQNGAPVA